MTKIYLVVFRCKNENVGIWYSTAFTNQRKAEQYKRYWEAQIRLKENFKNNEVYIVEKRICTKDYTKAANNAEMELLPY